MKFENSFKDWLPQNGIQSNVVDSYISYVKSIEDTIGDIDEFFDDAIRKAIQKKITKGNFPEKSAKLIINYKSGIRKYWQFIHDKNEDKH